MFTKSLYWHARQRQQKVASVIPLIEILARFAILLITFDMSESTGRGPNAQWTDEEMSALIDYLTENKSIGDANLNFKTAVYTAAAGHIAPLLVNGPFKDAARCKSKWGNVRRYSLLLW